MRHRFAALQFKHAYACSVYQKDVARLEGELATALGERNMERARAEAAEAAAAALAAVNEALEADVVELVAERERVEACLAEVEWRLDLSEKALHGAEVRARMAASAHVGHVDAARNVARREAEEIAAADMAKMQARLDAAEAGRSLRTSTRPTSNRQTESAHRL